MNAARASPAGVGRRRVASRLAFVFIVLASALGGCATPPPAPETPAAPGTPNLWSGRFAVTVSESGFQPREERSSGRFSLRASGDRRQLELSSPLGQTMAQVTLEPAGATLVTSDGNVHAAESAEALTEQVFGWRVPIGNLPRWLEGKVEHPTELDGARVVAGREKDWSIRYEAFDGARPRRLTLRWPAEAANALRRLELRLVVDSVVHVAGVPTQR